MKVEVARASTAPPSNPVSTGIGYRPGLDGLRGLSLIAIFGFHAGFAWAPGAFLSVSTFFTLSGFLITTLLLSEHARTGRIRLRAFWARRFRRLLPASLIAIAGIVIASAALANAGQLERLRGDVLASLAYVANWHFIASGDTYGALFATKSPIQHFWSLAIEEQFYFVYPLVIAAVLAGARGSRRFVAGALSALIGGSLAVSVILRARGASIDRLYFGTDVRAAELLVGALLAVWWVKNGDRTHASRDRSIVVGGALALVTMVVLWHAANRTDIAWYRGGLIGYACLTSLVILAALQPVGPVHRILSWRPLVSIGLVSYGAYLIHWPVFVWIDDRTGLAPWPLFALRIIVTFALAVPSYLLIEQPIRHGRLPRRWQLSLPPATIAATLVAAVLVSGNTVSQSTEITRAKAALQHLQPPTVATGGPSFAVFGDSTAAVDGFAIARWTYDHPHQLVPREGSPQLGCGMLEYDRTYRGGPAPYDPTCRGWIDHWRVAATKAPPDIALVMLGPWEVTDIRLPGETRERAVGDPKVDTLLVATLTRAVDTLFASGAHKVILVMSPPIDSGRVDGRSPPHPFPESDPRRMARWNAIQRQVAASRAHVGILDLAGYLATQTDDRRLRPDGVHFTQATAREMADWFAPSILRLARNL